MENVLLRSRFVGTLKHILCGCPHAINEEPQSRITWRHDSILLAWKKAIEHQVKSRVKNAFLRHVLDLVAFRNRKLVDFLYSQFNLLVFGLHMPHRKPNDEILYVNDQSNHPVVFNTNSSWVNATQAAKTQRSSFAPTAMILYFCRFCCFFSTKNIFVFTNGLWKK